MNHTIESGPQHEVSLGEELRKMAESLERVDTTLLSGPLRERVDDLKQQVSDMRQEDNLPGNTIDAIRRDYAEIGDEIEKEVTR